MNKCIATSTSIEQSNKLLDIGISKESADMHYHYRKYHKSYELSLGPMTLRGSFWTPERIKKLSKISKITGEIKSGEDVFDEIWGNDIPAWSLPKLMNILPDRIYSSNKHYDLFVSNSRILYMSIVDNELNFLYGFKITDDSQNIFDLCIEMIRTLKYNNHINEINK